MSIQTHVGLSQHPDLSIAVSEAASGHGIHAPRLVLFLLTFNYPNADLAAASRTLSALFPGAIVAGGTVNGLTLDERRYDAIYANDIAVAVIVFGGELTIAAALAPDARQDPFQTGKQLGLEIKTALKRAPESGLIFTPGLASSVPFIDQAILDGLRTTAPRLRVSGTGFSGGMTPESMSVPGYAVLGDRVEQLGTLLIAFDAPCGFSIANGMEALGPGAFITDTDGVFIRGLNDKPAREVALDLLSRGDEEAREHFAKNPAIAGIERGISLAIADPSGDFYWTHPIFFFTPDGAGADAFQPRKGAALSLVSIAPQTCMNAIKQAADMLVDDSGVEEFDLVLAFSCSLRGFTLGPNVAHEDLELAKHIKTRKRLGVVANFEIGCYRHGLPRSTAWAYVLFGLVGQGR